MRKSLDIDLIAVINREKERLGLFITTYFYIRNNFEINSHLNLLTLNLRVTMIDRISLFPDYSKKYSKINIPSIPALLHNFKYFRILFHFLVSRMNRKRWGYKYLDKRNWGMYNEKLVVRGEAYVSLDFVSSWKKDLKNYLIVQQSIYTTNYSDMLVYWNGERNNIIKV